MKRFLILALVAGASFTAGRIFDGLPKTAAAGAGQGGGVEKDCAATTGDVNADGEVNLTDAVTILGHLFQGNPTKLVGLCATQGSFGLPDTGQDVCYGFVEKQIWVEIPCAEATCPGQDGFHETGCPSEGRFVDNADGTVTDNCTGLMWQKDTGNAGKSLTCCDALAYCENLSLGGGLVAWDDWRLPNVRELQSIVDYGRVRPSIDPVFGALSSAYCSSTSLAGNPELAWNVYFDRGFVDIDGKDNTHFVRAVRNAP